jgi:hypothetical protein
MAGELITGDGQIEWHGLLLGAGSPYGLLGLTGWYGAPAPRRVSTDRPGRHGALPGELRAGERIVEAELQFGHNRPVGEFAATRDALAVALAWGENPLEESLVVQLDGVATMVEARVINADLPTNRDYMLGYATAAIQWAASDPRRYSLDLQQEITGLPEASTSGLAFPLGFDLDFGPGQAGGQLFLANHGNTPAWPVWQLQGPVTGPIITDAASGRQLRFREDFAILAGQILRIETDTSSVAIGQATRRHELTTAEWFPIEPGGGLTQVRFTASAGAGTLTGFVRHAWMT